MPVANARVQAVHVNRGANTDENGLAFLVGLPKNLETDVVVQPGSLENPFWRASVADRSITPRAGSIHRPEFPIVETAEIDGIVVVRRPGLPEPRPLSGITVRLVDASGAIVDSAVSGTTASTCSPASCPGPTASRPTKRTHRPYGLTAPGASAVDAGQGVVVSVDFVLMPPDDQQVAAAEPPAGPAAAVNLGTFQSRTGAEIGWILLQRQFSRGARPTRTARGAAGGGRRRDPAAGRAAECGGAAARVCAQLAALGQFCSVTPAQQAPPPLAPPAPLG